MEKLINGDTNPKKFLQDGAFDIDIEFSRWTSRKFPAIEEIVTVKSSLNRLSLLKLIKCELPNEPEIKSHLVLFIKETNRPSQSHMTQGLSVNLAQDEKMQCVVVLYEYNESPPSVNDLTCKEYEKILKTRKEGEPLSKKKGLIPDVKNGNIIIGA